MSFSGELSPSELFNKTPSREACPTARYSSKELQENINKDLKKDLKSSAENFNTNTESNHGLELYAYNSQLFKFIEKIFATPKPAASNQKNAVVAQEITFGREQKKIVAEKISTLKLDKDTAVSYIKNASYLINPKVLSSTLKKITAFDQIKDCLYKKIDVKPYQNFIKEIALILSKNPRVKIKELEKESLIDGIITQDISHKKTITNDTLAPQIERLKSIQAIVKAKDAKIEKPIAETHPFKAIAERFKLPHDTAEELHHLFDSFGHSVKDFKTWNDVNKALQTISRVPLRGNEFSDFVELKEVIIAKNLFITRNNAKDLIDAFSHFNIPTEYLRNFGAVARAFKSIPVSFREGAKETQYQNLKSLVERISFATVAASFKKSISQKVAAVSPVKNILVSQEKNSWQSTRNIPKNIHPKIYDAPSLGDKFVDFSAKSLSAILNYVRSLKMVPGSSELKLSTNMLKYNALLKNIAPKEINALYNLQDQFQKLAARHPSSPQTAFGIIARAHFMKPLAEFYQQHSLGEEGKISKSLLLSYKIITNYAKVCGIKDAKTMNQVILNSGR